MPDLSTEYMGLRLRNPVIVSSSSLTSTPDGVRRCADAGAGAVVLKSLFEEQIRSETRELEQYLWMADHPEAIDYVRNMGMILGPKEYLELISSAKESVKIPVIASLNCISSEWWSDYAIQIEKAGADALELNIAVMPSDPERRDEDIENLYFRILKEVRKSITLPISIKLGPYFTSMARMANELSKRGASALVLFNRFYRFDINIQKLEIVPGYRFSSPEEINTSLRWIALLSGRINCDLASSMGIHDGAGVIKELLAGATATYICSTLYLNGLKQIDTILAYVENWLKEHDFESIKQIKGKLSQMKSERPELYERLQYIKFLSGIED